MTPKITCVLPVYNGERYLKESIDSVLNQTFQDFELIIVDDGSTDNTYDISMDARGHDSRIRVIYHSTDGSWDGRKNFGLPAALNTGFQAAGGQYYTWTSADNRYAPDAFHKLYDAIQKTGVDVVYSGETFVDDNGNYLQDSPAADPKWLIYYNVVHASFLYRKTLQRYDESLKLTEDWAFWLQGATKGWKFAAIPDNLYVYRHHLGSLTAKRKTCMDAADKAFWKYAPNIPGVSDWEFMKAAAFRKYSRAKCWVLEDLLGRRYY